jgi:hypothetical protein
LKILIWATTFGSDLWSLARYLDNHPEITLKIVVANPRSYHNDGVSTLFPLKAEIVKRKPHSQIIGIPGFSPDITVMDNRVPLRRLSPKGFMLWHGFGWKGPNDLHEFAHLHKAIRRCWGSAMEPNENFRWHTFGPWDFDHRTKTSGFHPRNCCMVGAACHDDLRVTLDRKTLQEFYPFDVVQKKTVLIAPTWHYGEVFAHWGKDADLFNRLLSSLKARDTNVILRLHDSFRYPRNYLRFLNKLANDHENVLLKFKNRSPDNFLDMQVADGLITNFSSIANLFYATGRPTIHIYPVADCDEEFMWRRYTPVGIYSKKVDSVKYIWKLAPEENGGLLARSFPELLAQSEKILEEPDCCRAKSERFLKKYMLGADGRNCERICTAMSNMRNIGGSRKNPCGKT